MSPNVPIPSNIFKSLHSGEANLTIKGNIMSNSKKTPMTTEDAARIQSSTAKKNNGQVEKGSFAAKAQKAAAKNK